MSYDDRADDDVASDFRDALDGLTMNSRVEITTLTVIARENTEHAHAISEVMPARKLPALYLLDSIVKNVGTPYTIYFSRGLYTTFMDAYASVDNATRRKMDEMLKTWKEPVPGSVDPRPVFAPDTVRPIENALVKAKTSALQAQQEHMRTEQQLLGRGRPYNATPYRQTPTPPGGRLGYIPAAGAYGQQPPPQSQQQQQLQPQPQPQPPLPQQSYPYHLAPATTQTTPQPPSSATASTPFPPPTPQLPLLQQLQQQQQQGPFAPPGSAPRISIESVNEDIERLIQATKVEFAEKSYDASVAGRLKALLDLQMILKSQNLEYDKLILVKTQIDALSVNLPGHLKAQSAPTPTPPPATAAGGYPYYLPPQAPPTSTPTPGPGANQPISAAVAAAAAAAIAAARSGAAGATPVSAAQPAPPAGQSAALSIDSLLGKGTLAALMAARQQQQQPPPPPPQTQQQQQRQHQPTTTAMPAYLSPATASGLLAGLQAAYPSAAPTGANVPAAAGGNTGNPLALMDMLRKAGILQNASVPGGAHGTGTSGHPGSIPTPSVSLPSGIANALAPSGCGRRFRTDDAGRAAKTAHMDWHFRVHQRIAEAEKRGQHRSWYVDQADWIHSREAPEADGGTVYGGDGGSAAALRAAGGGIGGTGGDAAAGNAAAGGTGAGTGHVPWMPVPSGSASTNQICPICQERFEMKWLDEAQEWVWIDAVQVGPRVYHASCHAEATRGSHSRAHPAAAAMAAQRSSSTPTSALPPTGPAKMQQQQQQQHYPERVLGKRKADGNLYPTGPAEGHNSNGGNHHRKVTAPTGPSHGKPGGAGSGGRNSNNNNGSGSHHPVGRKKKRGGAGGGGGLRRPPPDLDRVDPDIGGGGVGGDGMHHGRNGLKRGGYWSDGGGGITAGNLKNGSGNAEDAKVDLNALPY
ncbi:mRNA cleavage factor complex component [Niveomyces insectorum RCEF 264]|uniref:mRNA cleavage factor complex component n=1 Tax=Niveomyces insectorum RCEF 264 TaxID=1081102 RepID=A0A167YMA5_9HYPO|nr:mRNA cleavage factor complex component [Niveomyces insectorum RCEF 264]